MSLDQHSQLGNGCLRYQWCDQILDRRHQRVSSSKRRRFHVVSHHDLSRHMMIPKHRHHWG